MMINKTSHCCKDTGCHKNIALVFEDISDFTIVWKWGLSIGQLRSRKNGRHLPDDIFKSISLNENVWISLKFSLTFVPEVLINNIPSLVPIMAWRRPGDKPLSEAMLVRLPTHICVTRLQWVSSITLITCHIEPSVHLDVMFYYFQPNNSTVVVCMKTLCGAPHNKIYAIIRWDTKNIMEHLGTYMHIWQSLVHGESILQDAK